MVVFEKITIYIDSTDRSGTSILEVKSGETHPTYEAYVNEIYDHDPGTNQIAFSRYNQGDGGVLNSSPIVNVVNMREVFLGPTKTAHNSVVSWWNDWGFPDDQTVFDKFLSSLCLWCNSAVMIHSYYGERVSLAPIRNYDIESTLNISLISGFAMLISMAGVRDESLQSGVGRHAFSNCCFHAVNYFGSDFNNVIWSNPSGNGVNNPIHLVLNNNYNTFHGLTYEILAADSCAWMVSAWDTLAVSLQEGTPIGIFRSSKLSVLKQRLSEIETKYDDVAKDVPDYSSHKGAFEEVFREVRLRAQIELEEIVCKSAVDLDSRLEVSASDIFNYKVKELDAFTANSIRLINDAGETAALTLQNEKVEDAYRTLDSQMERRRRELIGLGDVATQSVVKGMRSEFNKLLQEFSDKADETLRLKLQDAENSIKSSLVHECENLMKNAMKNAMDSQSKVCENSLYITLEKCTDKLDDSIKNVETRAEELLTYESSLSQELLVIEGRLTELGLFTMDYSVKHAEMMKLLDTVESYALDSKKNAQTCAEIKVKIESHMRK